MSSLIERFVRDRPYDVAELSPANFIPDSIEGCSAVDLVPHGDKRGELVELLTTRNGPVPSLVHVYQVFAEPGSLRGWVYHERQFDRLAFTNGRLKVVLHDLRESSPTFGKTNMLVLGEERKALLTIAPMVAHCVENIGPAVASFVNLPTNVFDPRDPDKMRLPVATGLIPYPDGP